MMAARHLGLVSPWNPFADDAYDIHMMPPTSAPTQYYDHPYAQYYDRSAAFSNSSSSSSSPGAPDDVYQVPWWYTVIFMIVFAAILCGSYCLRLACAKFCGWQMQDRHSRHPLARGSTSGMLRARSQAMAATEEIREVQLEKQRQERRLWYMFYLKAYTTVCGICLCCCCCCCCCVRDACYNSQREWQSHMLEYHSYIMYLGPDRRTLQMQ